MYYVLSIIFSNTVILILYSKSSLIKYHTAPMVVLTLQDSLTAKPSSSSPTHTPLSHNSLLQLSVPKRPFSHHLSVPYVLLLSPSKTLCFLNRSHYIYFNIIILIVYPKFMFDMVLWSISDRGVRPSFIMLHLSHFRDRSLI